MTNVSASVRTLKTNSVSATRCWTRSGGLTRSLRTPKTPVFTLQRRRTRSCALNLMETFYTAFVLQWLLCAGWTLRSSPWTARYARSRSRAVSTLPDSKIHGANMGPIWVRQDPGGPHVGPTNFAIWVVMSWLGYGARVTAPLWGESSGHH